MIGKPTTFFAPPEVETEATLASQGRRLSADPVVGALLDSFPEPAAVLNRCRQIVLANNKLAARLGRQRESLVGLRTGEAFGCIHAKKTPAGCGTGRSCRYCGSANATVDSLTSLQPQVQECRLLCSGARGVEAVDLQIWATPLVVGGEQFTVFAVRDTTDEKRRLLLERLFFHDILNAVATLKGIIKLWSGLTSEQADEMRRMVSDVTEQLVEEIHAQRDLASAERGDLAVEWETTDVSQILANVCEVYSHEAAEAGKIVAAPCIAGATQLRTVPVLLRRVLGNLIKNALEASRPGETVSVSFENHGVPTLRVHNPGGMSDAVQAQMFQRSFTTKEGHGRGIGTYSVKLFVENYLRGTVSFLSTAQAGTTFIITLPSPASAPQSR